MYWRSAIEIAYDYYENHVTYGIHISRDIVEQGQHQPIEPSIVHQSYIFTEDMHLSITLSF